MNKLKKSKGFTLIEMLVVIAIIAVLVSIIIPVVGNSTTKAKAAANAANLRSVKAEITIKMLAAQGTEAGTTFNPGDYDDIASTVKWNELTAENVGEIPNTVANAGTFNASGGFAAAYTNGVLTVTYDGLTINGWAYLAGNAS